MVGGWVQDGPMRQECVGRQAGGCTSMQSHLKGFLVADHAKVVCLGVWDDSCRIL